MNNKAKQLEQPLSQKAIRYEAWKQKLEHERNDYTTTVKEESRCFQAATQQNKAIFLHSFPSNTTCIPNPSK